MKRLHLFELEDLSWFPSRIRNYMTDFLRTIAETVDLFGPAVDEISKMLDSQRSRDVVDLASGGGGQWRTMFSRLREKVPGVRLALTDFYPNREALDRVASVAPDAISVESAAVDARDVPEHLHGVRTMFLSLHHFKPEDATAILSNAVTSGSPIAVFEAQQRDLIHLFQFAMSPIAVLLLTPFIRPFSIGRLCFTYLLPVVPMCVGFDGVVSVLRTYKPSELLQMAEQADPEGQFEWEARVVPYGRHKVMIFSGQPRTP